MKWWHLSLPSQLLTMNYLNSHHKTSISIFDFVDMSTMEFSVALCADNHGQTGKVSWKDNWVAFLDNMLQMKLFEKDSRDILLPTSLQKLTIDPKQHAAEVQELNNKKSEVVVPVHVYKELNIIQSAGVEFRGLKTNAISWRKPQSNPVLEKYVFTQNVEPTHLDLHTTLRVCMHITVENKPVTQVKVVELHTQGSTPLSPAVTLIFADRPLLKASITIWDAGSHVQSSGIH
ncbi:hypothetical protein B7P43_G14906, partial [Cryptotermes secundus]